MDEFLKKYPLFNQLDVSRETCLEFEEFTSMIIKKNSEINLISRNNSNNDAIMDRHRSQAHMPFYSPYFMRYIHFVCSLFVLFSQYGGQNPHILIL